VQSAVDSGARLYPWQVLRFRLTGNVYAKGSNDLQSLPASTVICNCQQVSLGQIRSHLETGPCSVELLQQELGVASVCGSCKPLVQQLTRQPIETLPVRTPMLSIATLSLLALGAFLFLPAVSPSETVQAPGVEYLWTENLPRQISGFTMLGLISLSLLLSLRKRLKFFKWLQFETWRYFHVILAAAALVILFVHTGMSTGQGINFWLLVNFTLVILVGIVAAGLAAVEGHWLSTTLKRIKRSLVLGHIVTFWPLPLLLGFHVLSVYYF